MAEYKFDPETSDTRTDILSSKIAQLLDGAQIPNVVWGWVLLKLHGVPTITCGPEFIVPDHLLESAYTTLLAAGFPACQEGEACKQCRYDRHSPIPDKHFHYYSKYQSDVVALYKKSLFIWALPDLELGLPAPDDPNFMLASDNRLPPWAIRGGSGPWSSSLYPVKILTAPRYTEALILLWCRDEEHCNNYSGFWSVNLSYISEYVRKRGFMRNEQLHPMFLSFWQSSLMHWHSEIAELRRTLIENNKLPPPPPINSFGSVERALGFGKYVT